MPDDHDIPDSGTGTEWVHSDENAVQRCATCGEKTKLVDGPRSGVMVCEPGEESLFYY